jgi:hypothetical protein
MKSSHLVLFNAIGIFPIIISSSSMKLILSQTFHIGLTYSTIVSFAGVLSIFKFLLTNRIQHTSLNILKNYDNYQQWGFIGSTIMTSFLGLIYFLLLTNPFKTPSTLALVVTILSAFIVLGEMIAETAINVFYAHGDNKKSLSYNMFVGHKIAALLGYFLFPMIVEYGGIHWAFIPFLLLSFFLNGTFLMLPKIENTPKKVTSDNIMTTIYKDLMGIPQIYMILLFIITCQMGSLVIGGMKCNFIAQVTKKKFLSYMLRGLGLIVGIFGGTKTKTLTEKVFKTDSNTSVFMGGALLHLISVLINFMAFKLQTNWWFIIATIFENLNKGYMMASLTKFFLVESHKKPHILAFFWGFFSLLRSIYGGISGYLVTTLGINGLFFGLIGASFIPIVITYFLKPNSVEV